MAIRKIDWANITEDMANSGAKKKYEKKVDENLYKYKLKNGESAVLIRFLPAPVGDIDLPYAEVKKHVVKVNGKLMIETCPQSVGGRSTKCPICEHGTKVFFGGDKDLGKKFFAKSDWYVNILIVNDVNTPENNGKIFVLKVGKGLFTKIKAKTSPSEEDKAMGIKAVNVFDYEDGMNFKLKIVEKSIPDSSGNGQMVLVPNYDNSAWADSCTPIGLGGKALTEDEINSKIEPNLIPLKPYLLDGMKSYEQLVTSLERVTGIVSGGSSESSERSSGNGSSSYDKDSGTYPLPSEETTDDEFFRKLRGDS